MPSSRTRGIHPCCVNQRLGDTFLQSVGVYEFRCDQHDEITFYPEVLRIYKMTGAITAFTPDMVESSQEQEVVIGRLC